MSERTEVSTTAGRPRNPGLDASILTATRTLLAEVGYAKTTISAISRASGVATPAIYRRWSSKEAIVEEAVFGVEGATPPSGTGDLRADLLAWTHWFLGQIAEPAVRSAVPGLLASYQNTAGAYEKLVARSDHPIRHALIEVIADQFPAAPGKAAKVGDEVFDLLVASTVVRGLTRGEAGAGPFCDQLAETLALIVESRLS
ncbi:TetR/AcrR family transcriptional regulator [Gordonia sp. (in: high G+C Gram-positive bacteria)]|uniref:TetR/AcrR family transcriptional regulator n=1 Tax=Gordonia sp. (in: high G+C Gram-positive bacteria) TaxID=84139 RepID=UPI0039E2DF45